MASLDTDLAHALDRGRAAARAGRVATYIPELAKADASLAAIAVHTVSGETAIAGDAECRFTLQSVAKVFALACVMGAGRHDLFDYVSMEPSGDAFHSIVRLEEERGRPRNPLINAGAIVVSEHLPGRDPTARIAGLRDYLGRLTGSRRALFEIDEAVYASERETGFRNRALANYMKHFGVVSNPEAAVDTYFRQCSITATVAELARAGAFLANDGVEPETRSNVLSRTDNRAVLALMATCGLYDEVGRFAVRVGVPAKSGVSGAMLAVVPGRMAIACFGPALGAKGNSLAGMAMLESLAQRIELSVFSP